MHKNCFLLKYLDALSRISLARLLVAAAVLHVLLVITINIIGRAQLMPRTFDQNGIGISFAVDSAEYRDYVLDMKRVLEEEGAVAWLKYPRPFHVNFLSLCFAVLGPVFGYNTLSAEPLNLIYYLLILALVFAVAREVFDHRVGVLTAILVGLWPSFLLHTTQLLRDPLFANAMLAFMLACVTFLTRNYSWKRGLAVGLCAGLATNIIWLIRSQIWEVVLAVSLLTLCLSIYRDARGRRFATGNLLGCVLLVMLVVGLPRLGERFNLYSYPTNVAEGSSEAQVVSQGAPVEVVNRRVLPPGSGLPARISYMRATFLISYPNAGSNIDTNVVFKSLWDIILYLPRAAEIGFLAPFPNMWVVPGPQVGLAGRLLVGAETLAMYLIELLAIMCLWRYRKHLPVWFLFITAAVAVVALGLVVSNIATLYRMRYVFWIPLIILGMKQLMDFASTGVMFGPIKEGRIEDEREV